VEVQVRKTVQWLVMLVALVATVTVLAARRQDRPGPTIARWEFRVLRMADSVTVDANLPTAELTRLGHEGWDLVGVTRRQIQVQAELQTETVFYMKRAIVQ
jgi:hypothetical protein